ncbi:MAG TPA: DUF6644 family protein [Burkholderiales bacterium]|jgi:hypothetical protein|nr:DUF6644 family protein [Burkholderiales bacterium]
MSPAGTPPGGQLLQALEHGGIGEAMRNSIWLYPAVETLHIVGFILLVGAVLMFDLRVLGLSRRVPVRMLAGHLLPWGAAALVLIVPAGLLLFAADATAMVGNRAFVLKMILLMAAATNAAAFHLGPFRSVTAWDQGITAPLSARLHAGASLVLWLAIIACGRMIAYA